MQGSLQDDDMPHRRNHEIQRDNFNAFGPIDVGSGSQALIADRKTIKWPTQCDRLF
jgi:hypothetical protein